MIKKTVFLLDNSKEANERLFEKFRNCEDYEIVGMESDAINVVSSIEKLRPDYLISELVFAGFDGIEVIKQVKALNVKTRIIILSALKSEEAILRSVLAGAEYFLAKPLNFGILYERMGIINSTEVNKRNISEPVGESLEEKISKIFITVGIPPHIKGYCFLREGVKMAVEDPDIINNITKKLYPMIGEKYQTSASKVERAIRHAIEVAWNRGRIESINAILGVRAYIGAEKPTNGEFIALVADKMLLEKA